MEYELDTEYVIGGILDGELVFLAPTYGWEYNLNDYIEQAYVFDSELKANDFMETKEVENVFAFNKVEPSVYKKTVNITVSKV